jgi:hypothetical protein
LVVVSDMESHLAMFTQMLKGRPRLASHSVARISRKITGYRLQMHNLFATILQFGSDLLPVRSDALIDGRAAGLYN